MTGNDIYCFNNGWVAVVDTVGGSTPYSYRWSNGATTDSINIIQAGLYTLTVTDASGCNISNSYNISEIPLILLQADEIICSGDCIYAGGNFQSQSGMYYDTLISATGCDTILITSLFVSNSTLDSTALLICFGDSVFTGGKFQNQQGIYVDSFLNTHGCDSVTITALSVSDEIEHVLVSAGDIIVYGEEVQLNITGGNYYNWSPNESLSCQNCPNPMASPLSNTTYRVTITNNDGCFVTDSVQISLTYEGCNRVELFIPNAFTPDGDNNNDTFSIIKNNGILIESFEVYDRWGEKIFKANNNTIGWDGTYKGKKCDPGVYVYVLKGNCLDKSIMKKGSITLIR